jgi:ribosomal protein S18 acetylase RimI-like enzyme
MSKREAGVQIRTFDFDKHFDAVVALWESSGPGIRLSRSDTPDKIKHKLERDPDLFLVAEERGDVIGAVLGGYDGRRGIVYHLAVRRQHRNKGVGQDLMRELETRLRAKGCIKYYLLVTKDNPEAVDFYEHMGVEVMDLTIMGKAIA